MWDYGKDDGLDDFGNDGGGTMVWRMLGMILRIIVEKMGRLTNLYLFNRSWTVQFNVFLKCFC